MKKIITAISILSVLAGGIIALAESTTVDVTTSGSVPGVGCSVADGSVNFGTFAPNYTKDTIALGDTQTLTNTSIGYSVLLSFKGSNYINGSNTITLTSPTFTGDNQIKEQVATGGIGYSNMTTDWKQLGDAVAEGGTRTFDINVLLSPNLTVAKGIYSSQVNVLCTTI
jgi:hypothetical protein